MKNLIGEISLELLQNNINNFTLLLEIFVKRRMKNRNKYFIFLKV